VHFTGRKQGCAWLCAFIRVLDAIGERCALLAQHKKMGRARPERAPDLHPSPAARSVLYERPIAEGIELVRAPGAARDVNALFDFAADQDR
jgi:plasmid stabilization system protein ParE